MRFRNSLLASICIVGLQVGMVPTQCRAAEPAAILQHALGSQEALYKFSPETLAGAVKRCAGEDPTHAGTYVALVLRSGRPDPSRDQVAGIVRLSVYSAPSEVLDIVTAAVKASPRSAAPAIVTAAVSTVPHPERLVTVNVERRAARAPGNDKQTDNKQLADDKSVTPPEQKHLTLAEAIVQAALNADPGLSESSLAAAADNGLNFAFATSRPPVLTGVLAPIIPVLPSIPSTGAGSTSVTFSGPGPVSP
jgi:hypothetical protein